MRIAEFLREDLVFPALAAADKEGVVRELCGGLARAYPSLSAAKLAETLLEREKLGSTGIGEGVAIPHGKLPGIPGLLAAFARRRGGGEFAALAGETPPPFFLFFFPPN